MPDVRARLTHLLDLAERDAAEERSRLVNELSALLLAWPEDYPLTMRRPFEQLLERTAESADPKTRAELATRFAAQWDAPIGLLNRLFFDAPEAVKPAILRRNALAHEAGPNHHGQSLASTERDEAALITAIRGRGGDPATSFAATLRIDTLLATRILADASGEALAAACKGAHLKRTTFSALALLFGPNADERERRLAAYDAVPQDGAESLVAFWRAHPQTPSPQSEAA